MKLRNVTLHKSSRFQIIPEYGISNYETAINTASNFSPEFKRTVGDYTTSGSSVLIELVRNRGSLKKQRRNVQLHL